MCMWFVSTKANPVVLSTIFLLSPNQKSLDWAYHRSNRNVKLRVNSFKMSWRLQQTNHHLDGWKHQITLLSTLIFEYITVWILDLRIFGAQLATLKERQEQRYAPKLNKCALGRVILKLDNKNQKLLLCSELNSMQLLLFDQSPKMPRKLVKIYFLFIKENIRKDRGNSEIFGTLISILIKKFKDKC